MCFIKCAITVEYSVHISINTDGRTRVIKHRRESDWLSVQVRSRVFRPYNAGYKVNHRCAQDVRCKAIKCRLARDSVYLVRTNVRYKAIKRRLESDSSSAQLPCYLGVVPWRIVVLVAIDAAGVPLISRAYSLLERPKNHSQLYTPSPTVRTELTSHYSRSRKVGHTDPKALAVLRSFQGPCVVSVFFWATCREKTVNASCC